MLIFVPTIGEVPFSHMLPVAVVMAVAVRKEKPRLPPDVDQRVRELIDGCIAWQSEDRLTILQVCVCVCVCVCVHMCIFAMYVCVMSSGSLLNSAFELLQQVIGNLYSI